METFIGDREKTERFIHRKMYRRDNVKDTFTAKTENDNLNSILTEMREINQVFEEKCAVVHTIG